MTPAANSCGVAEPKEEYHENGSTEKWSKCRRRRNRNTKICWGLWNWLHSYTAITNLSHHEGNESRLTTRLKIQEGEPCWGAIYQSFFRANYRGMCSHTSSWLVGWLADFWVSNTNKRELKLSISLSNVKVRAAVPACINTTSIPFLTHLLKNASVWRYSIWF